MKTLLKTTANILLITALLLGTMHVIQIVAATTPPGDSVTVAWDPNPEPDIAKYTVYWGIVGSTATNTVDTAATQQGVPGLVYERQYWFYVTASNTVGLESDPSTILFYTTRDAPVPGQVNNLNREVLRP